MARRDVRLMETLLFEEVPVAMARLDSSGRFLEANEKFAKLVRYSRNELLSLTLAEVSFGASNSAAMELLRRFAEGEITEYVKRRQYERKDGTVIWVKIHVKAVPGPSFVVVADDVTDDVREEESLQQTKTALQSTIAARTSALQQINSQLKREILERESAESTLQKKTVMIELLQSITGTANQSRDPNDLIHNSLERICKAMHVEAGCFRFESDSAPVWYPVCGPGSEDLKPSFSFPIVIQNEIIGSMTFYSSRESVFSSGQAAILDQIGIQIGHVFERAEADRKLKDSEAMLNSIFSSAPVMLGIAQYEAGDFRVLSANSAFSDFFGIPVESVLNRCVSELGLSFSELAIAAAHSRGSEFSGAPIQFDYVHEKTQRKYWFTIASNYIGKSPEGHPRFAWVVMDITERKLREENLAFINDIVCALTSSLDYRVALKQFTHHCLPKLGDMCVVDIVQGDQIERVALTHVDPDIEKDAAYFISRYPLRMNKPHPSLYAIRTGKPDLYRSIPADLIEKVSYDEVYRQKLLSLGLKSGMVVPILSGQKILGAITFYVTNSDRVFNQKDLELAQELASRVGLALENAMLYTQAREEVRLRENLMSIVSHDLKNPLLSIRLNTQLIDRAVECGTDAEFLKGAAERIRFTSIQMGRLIDDLLDVSKMESRGLAVDRKNCELQPIIAQAIDVYRPIAQEKSIDLELDCPSELSCACDPVRITQVISNLLGNAVKFSPPGKSIRLTVNKNEGEIQVAVADEGPGIPSDHLHRVFDRYWQAPQVKRGGIGLGLHIAKGIVEAHQGRIWAESSGAGSRFQFTLPS